MLPHHRNQNRLNVQSTVKGRQAIAIDRIVKGNYNNYMRIGWIIHTFKNFELFVYLGVMKISQLCNE